MILSETIRRYEVKECRLAAIGSTAEALKQKGPNGGYFGFDLLMLGSISCHNYITDNSLVGYTLKFVL